MLYGFNPCGSGQDFIEIAAPSSGVIVAIAMDDGIVENIFNACLNPFSGFGFCVPDGFKDCGDVLDSDGVHRLVADYGEGVGLEGTDPLFGVFVVIPCASLCADVASGAGGESGGVDAILLRLDLCIFRGGGDFHACDLALMYRVDTLFCHFLIIKGEFPCFLQVDIGHAAQAHFSVLAVAGVA